MWRGRGWVRATENSNTIRASFLALTVTFCVTHRRWQPLFYRLHHYFVSCGERCVSTALYYTPDLCLWSKTTQLHIQLPPPPSITYWVFPVNTESGTGEVRERITQSVLLQANSIATHTHTSCSFPPQCRQPSVSLPRMRNGWCGSPPRHPRLNRSPPNPFLRSLQCIY